MNLARWFQAMWPTDSKRALVVDGYRALAHNKLLLTDIALRAGLFQEDGEEKTLYRCGVEAGRRELALEIVKAAETDPMALMAYAENLRSKS